MVVVKVQENTSLFLADKLPHSKQFERPTSHWRQVQHLIHLRKAPSDATLLNTSVTSDWVRRVG